MQVLNTAQLHHTAFVVHDIEKSAKNLAESMGLQWNVWTIEPASSTVHGQDMNFTFRVALAAIGDSNFEIIMPLTGHNIYVEHLNAHGEGFHHACVTYGTLKELHQARDSMLKQGRTMLQSASLGDAGEFYYFEIAETGSILELLYLDAHGLPAPEQTIG